MSFLNMQCEVQQFIVSTLKDATPEQLLEFMPLLKGQYDEILLRRLGYIPNIIDQVYPDVYPVTTPCGHGMMIHDDCQSDNICSECGIILAKTEYTIGYNDRKNYQLTRASIYNPIDHFQVILEEMQCKRCDIEYTMLDEIRHAIGNKPITYYNVRRVLRKLDYRQHYLWIPTILQNLEPSLYQPLQLTSVQTNHLRRRFQEYLIAFHELTPRERNYRKNILNYHFVLSELAKQLGYLHILPYIQELRGQKTIDNHNQIWKLICLKIKQ